MQQAKKLPHGAEFKDTVQVGQFKDLLDPFRRIHQLKHDCVGTSRLDSCEKRRLDGAATTLMAARPDTHTMLLNNNGGTNTFSLPLPNGEPSHEQQTDFPDLLRRRGSSRCLLLRLHLLVMVLVLRGALARLSRLGLRRSCRSRRGGGALRLSGGRSLSRRSRRALRLSGRRSLCRRGGRLRGVLCHCRQRQCKHDERPEDYCK